MPQFVISLWFLINELLRIPFDIVRGTAQRRYSCAFDIQAPKDVTWSVASAHKITLEGFPPFAIDTEPDPNRPGVFTGFVRSASKNYAFAYRVLEERLGEAMTLEILSAESDRIFQLGENYKCAVGVSGDGAKSNLIASSGTKAGASNRFLATTGGLGERFGCHAIGSFRAQRALADRKSVV